MRRVISFALAGALVLTLAGTTLAAKGGNGKGNAGTGSTAAACSVAPDPVAVGTDWTMTGTGLPANTYVSVFENDGNSTTAWFGATDAAGSISITWHSYNTGTTTIAISTAITKHVKTLATCSFQVD